MQHVFCDDGIIIDLRYLVIAEVFDAPPEHEDDRYPFAIHFICEVGSTPQRSYASYMNRATRDEAFARLTAMHQAWLAHTHAGELEEDD
jgi:hypothetical protein